MTRLKAASKETEKNAGRPVGDLPDRSRQSSSACPRRPLRRRSSCAAQVMETLFRRIGDPDSVIDAIRCDVNQAAHPVAKEPSWGRVAVFCNHLGEHPQGRTEGRAQIRTRPLRYRHGCQSHALKALYGLKTAETGRTPSKVPCFIVVCQNTANLRSGWSGFLIRFQRKRNGGTQRIEQPPPLFITGEPPLILATLIAMAMTGDALDVVFRQRQSSACRIVEPR